MLHAVLVVAFVLCAIGPRLLTFALLDIIHPLSFIPAAIHVGVDANPTSLVCFEVADVNVALSVPKGPFAFSLVVEPVALVNSSINPLLDSEATTLLNLPLGVDNHLPLVE